ncbi:hypothetical protein ACFSPU_12075 [Haoranjiania flava]|uniref:Uncharacterized protein n=1 Tax=Haoranjiania flava TaxID=1856322 RepID=A0AAE3IQE2_9BACT|nr:hypothetical protein [Haoranjiania flava]MCU7695241.1 hypothetical protein [Haoranjiania flava]
MTENDRNIRTKLEDYPVYQYNKNAGWYRLENMLSPGKRKSAKWWHYAAAACLGGAIIFMYLNREKESAARFAGSNIPGVIINKVKTQTTGIASAKNFASTGQKENLKESYLKTRVAKIAAAAILPENKEQVIVEEQQSMPVVSAIQYETAAATPAKRKVVYLSDIEKVRESTSYRNKAAPIVFRFGSQRRQEEVEEAYIIQSKSVTNIAIPL